MGLYDNIEGLGCRLLQTTGMAEADPSAHARRQLTVLSVQSGKS